jgi:hypothetical protein
MRFLRAILCCAVLLAVVGASPARGQQPIHSHLFRHQMLTYLTSKGLSDADPTNFRLRKQKSLEVYQHLSLESVDKAYQDAVQTAGI